MSLPSLTTAISLLVACGWTTAADAQPGEVCASAIPLRVSAICPERPTVYSTAALSRFSGQRGDCRGANESVDAWFSFVAPATGAVNVRLAADDAVTDARTALWGPRFELYGGSCDALRQVGCGLNASGSSSITSLALDLLTPGDTYYVRVASAMGPNAPGEFSLCVRAYAPEVFAKSDCVAGAILCDLGPVSVSGLNGAGADPDEVDYHCAIVETNTVWYRWTAASAGRLAFTLRSDDPSGDLDFAVYDLGVGGLADCRLSAAKVIACNAAGGGSCRGTTGLRAGEPFAFEGPNCHDSSPPEFGNTGFSAPAVQEPGHSYALVVNEYDALGAGFAIDFAGSTVTLQQATAEFTVEPLGDEGRKPSYRVSAAVGGLVYDWDFGPGVTVVGGSPATRTVDIRLERRRPTEVGLTVRTIGDCSASSRQTLRPRATPDPGPTASAPPPSTAPLPSPTPQRIAERRRQPSGTQLRFPTAGPARLGVFDHKRLDGDTVSVTVDGRLVLDSIGLTRAPQWTSLELSPGTHTLTLFAENLGDVSPNTATILVEVNGVTEEAVLSSDLGESATLEIVVGEAARSVGPSAPAEREDVGARPFGDHRVGDFVFQDLDCGPLCDAIESVTPALDGTHFSHVGLVHARGDGLYVYEAISKGGVVSTPLADFLARTPANVTMRLSPKHAPLLDGALGFCESQMGVPYDDVYLLGNGRYYCSELLYAAFAHANGGRPVFALHPMTFKPPGGTDFDPAWVAYYEQLDFPIPEGELGCNPGGLATGGVLVEVD